MQHHLIVGVQKRHPLAVIPAYATEGSGCFDLFPVADGIQLNVEHGRPLIVDLGIAVEVPPGHVMLVFSRSGHGFKYDVRLANGTGIIDSDFRDTVKVKLTCDDPHGNHYFKIGTAIAQAIVIPFPRCMFEERDYLSDTARGLGGLGSTDAARGAA